MTAQPVPANVQMLAGHVRNWLTRNGFPVRDFQVAPREGVASAGWAVPGEVSFTGPAAGKVASAANRYGQRGRLDFDQIDGLRTMMHEGLHQMRYGRTPGFYTDTNSGDGYWEEAATEAVNQDLLPIFIRQLYGDTSALKRKAGNAQLDDAEGEGYAERVKQLRQLSTFASGAANYTKRPARVWRRTFQHADTETRRSMLAQAEQARSAWGARTGR